jgi:hypothetical protein
VDNKELIEKGGKAVARYRTDLVAWVKYVFPDVVLTSQQRHLLVEVGKLYAAKIKRYKGEEMTAEEREYAAKIGISVMSGHWTGKDFISAIIHDHFLCNFPYPKLVCTANTFKQLKNVFHSEVVKSFRLSRKVDEDGATYLDSLLEIQAEKVFLKQLKGREWFSEFVTVATRGTKEEQAECLAGRNADFKLTIVDEASGIPYAVFKPFEGAMSGIINIVIMIFNPTRSSGYAIDSHGKNRERWLCFRWNAEESERTNKDAIKDLERRYGRDSNVSVFVCLVFLPLLALMCCSRRIGYRMPVCASSLHPRQTRCCPVLIPGPVVIRAFMQVDGVARCCRSSVITQRIPRMWGSGPLPVHCRWGRTRRSLRWTG